MEAGFSRPIRAQPTFAASKPRMLFEGSYLASQFPQMGTAYAIIFRRLAGKEDWLAVLKDCPVSMDDVPPRRRAPARRRTL